MLDNTKFWIEKEFGECLNAEELAIKYAEIYVFIKDQLHYCMDCLTKEDDEE